MNTLIALAGAIAYLAVTTVVAGFAARWLADHWGLCTKRHDRLKTLCVGCHPVGCWRATGEITPTVLGAGFGVALLWPLSILPLAAYLIAVRRPSPLLADKRIAELERELGIRR